MEQKVTFKKPDGTLQEVRFDDFDSFADSMEGVAQQYYAGLRPEVDVQSIYSDGFIVNEKVTTDVEQSTNRDRTEFLSE